MRRTALMTALSCSVLAIGLTLAAARPQQSPRSTHDGHWWLSISPAERSGFLNGYFDCYTYEYKGPAKFTINPPAIARGLITKFYEGNPSRLTEPVPDAFFRFRDRAGEKSAATGGEPVKGRHGFYDGTYWKQISALGGDAEQLGFIEGYLWCHAHLSRNEGGVFSKAPSLYVSLISGWYGFVTDTGDIDAKREPAKIADVLFKFRDHAQHSNRGSNQAEISLSCRSCGLPGEADGHSTTHLASSGPL